MVNKYVVNTGDVVKNKATGILLLHRTREEELRFSQTRRSDTQISQTRRSDPQNM